MASATNGAPAPIGTGTSAAVDGSTNKNDETKATAATYGALDTSQVSNEMWMVRIPPNLAQAWQDAPEGTVLGDLVFTKGSSNHKPAATEIASVAPKQSNSKPVKPSLTVHVSEDLVSEKQSSDLPLTYSMEAMTKRVPVLHPFTRKSDGSVALHGTVSRTANLQVQRDGRYRQLLKNRLLQTNVNSNRFVKPVESTELSVRKQASSALTNKAGFGSAVQEFGKRLAEASEGGGGVGDNSRKRKFEGQTTRSVVFELFSQQPFWTVKEIVRNSGRPEKEIRQVLSEIGGFHRSGEHKQQWELRKEYQSKKDGR